MIKVSDLSERARRDMRLLAKSYPNRPAFFEAVASQVDGLASHWVTRFFYGQADNPTEKQLDRLLTALDLLNREAAA